MADINKTKIKETTINDVLNEFDFNKANSFSCMQHYETEVKFRIVFKVITVDKRKLVIKFFNDRDVSRQALNMHGVMSNLFIRNGIEVSKRYKHNDGNYYITKDIDGRITDITVEEFICGNEMKRTSLFLMSEIGKRLGKMHLISEEENLIVGNGSASSLFVGTESDKLGEFDENMDNFKFFKNILKNNQYENDLVNEIISLYEKKRSQLKQVWAELPRGAVQGDLSPNNILLDKNNKINGIIDFHIAGDEVFINDMLSTGIFLAYEIEPTEDEININKDQYLLAFISGYKEYRTLSSLEYSVMNNIYNITRPFRYRNVIKLKEMLAGNRDYNKIDKKIGDMYRQVSREIF